LKKSRKRNAGGNDALREKYNVGLNALSFNSCVMNFIRENLIRCRALRHGITNRNNANHNQAKPEHDSKQFQNPLTTPHAWPTPERFAA
jgi:hypothetical protein